MTKILMILTSHDRLGDTGEKTGFWLEEFAAPYYVFKDAGAEVTLASPQGGQPPLDPKSDEEDFQTDATRRFKDDKEAQEQLASTERLDEIYPTQYDAVFYPGGHGPMWDLAENADSRRIIEAFVNNDRSARSVTPRPSSATPRPRTASRWSRAARSPASPMARKKASASPMSCRSCSRTCSRDMVRTTPRARIGRPTCWSTANSSPVRTRRRRKRPRVSF